MNNHITMGWGRWLCYAINAERRWMENEELERRPGLRPLVDGRVGPAPQRFISWERPWEENFNRHWIRGRSRPILTPRPFLQVHHRLVPPGPPQGVAARFGPMVPNIPGAPRVNNPQPHFPWPQHHVLPPPPLQDQEDCAEESPSESSESREGDSLEVNHGSS